MDVNAAGLNFGASQAYIEKIQTILHNNTKDVFFPLRAEMSTFIFEFNVIN